MRLLMHSGRSLCAGRGAHAKDFAVLPVQPILVIFDPVLALNLLIGDGRSDFCAAASADLVIAKGALAVYCGKNGIAFEPFIDFAGASTILARWLVALGPRATPQSAEESAYAPRSA